MSRPQALGIWGQLPPADQEAGDKSLEGEGLCLELTLSMHHDSFFARPLFNSKVFNS